MQNSHAICWVKDLLIVIIIPFCLWSDNLWVTTVIESTEASCADMQSEVLLSCIRLQQSAKLNLYLCPGSHVLVYYQCFITANKPECQTYPSSTAQQGNTGGGNAQKEFVLKGPWQWKISAWFDSTSLTSEWQKHKTEGLYIRSAFSNSLHIQIKQSVLY